MNLSEIQAEVKLIVGNMQASHPFYSLVAPSAGSEDTSVINRAANRLIVMAAGKDGLAAPGLFGTKLENSWTVGPTVDATNRVARPSDCLAIQAVSYAKQDTLPDWDITEEYPSTYKDRVKFGFLRKGTTVTGYPSIFSLKGSNILIHPTPDDDHICYLRVYGIKKETALSSASDSFVMEEEWHGVVARLAAQMILEMMGKREKARDLLESVKQEIRDAISVTVLEGQVGMACVDGLVDRGGVYGG